MHGTVSPPAFSVPENHTLFFSAFQCPDPGIPFSKRSLNRRFSRLERARRSFRANMIMLLQASPDSPPG